MNIVINPVDLYVGHARVRAMRMLHSEYMRYMGENVEVPTNEGYFVEVLNTKPNDPRYNNYVTWLPADVFDTMFRQVYDLLDGQTILRNPRGFGQHPALPIPFYYSAALSSILPTLGCDVFSSTAQDELDPEAFDYMTLDNPGYTDFSKWVPKRPEGDGWSLVAVLSCNRSGAVALWCRPSKRQV